LSTHLYPMKNVITNNGLESSNNKCVTIYCRKKWWWLFVN